MLDKNQYFIKDLGLGSGTFLRTLITAHSALRNGQIVIFGENQRVVGITHGKNRQGTDKQQQSQEMAGAMQDIAR